jgi:ABC-type polysaccharide/polyol phosphate export permease
VAQAAPVVTRLPFPRAVLPFSLVGLSLLDFAVSGAIFLVFALFTRTALPVTGLWFPVLLLIEIAFTAGVALLGSALNVFARDVKLAVPLIVQLWLFITPVMYPLSSVPSGLRRWYQLNPMTGLVESFRSVLLFGKAPRSQDLVPAVVGAVVLLVVGWWYFAATERRFADVI